MEHRNLETEDGARAEVRYDVVVEERREDGGTEELGEGDMAVARVFNARLQ
jgi:hypothetical protein